MTSMWVTVLICASSVQFTDCDKLTARAYRSYASEQAICGMNVFAPIAGSVMRPQPDEYIRIRCEERKEANHDR